MGNQDGAIAISVVIPVFNEEANVTSLTRDLTAVMGGGRPWEVVWVDDGSEDGSLSLLTALSREPASRHRVVALPRRSGQSVALLAGIAQTSAPILITLDADGQYDCADIPVLLERLESERVDMVQGVRSSRQDGFMKKVSSRLANGFRRMLIRDNYSDVGCALRVLRRECISGLPAFKGTHRFLPVLVSLNGGRVVEQSVTHRPRAHGRTHYGVFNRLWVGLADTLAVYWMRRRYIWKSAMVERNSAEPDQYG